MISKNVLKITSSSGHYISVQLITLQQMRSGSEVMSFTQKSMSTRAKGKKGKGKGRYSCSWD